MLTLVMAFCTVVADPREAGAGGTSALAQASGEREPSPELSDPESEALKETEAYLVGGGQIDAVPLCLLAKEAIGKLDQDARAIARVRVAAARPTMLEIDEHLDAFVDELVRLLAGDVGDESDATGVVLLCRVVEPLGLGSTVPSRVHWIHPFLGTASGPRDAHVPRPHGGARARRAGR